MTMTTSLTTVSQVTVKFLQASDRFFRVPEEVQVFGYAVSNPLLTLFLSHGCLVHLVGTVIMMLSLVLPASRDLHHHLSLIATWSTVTLASIK
jgi:hypothetical protein